MSVTKKFIELEKKRHFKNIEYFENMLNDIEKNKTDKTIELIKDGLILVKEQACKHINKEHKEIALYDKLIGDDNFKISEIDYLIEIRSFLEIHLKIVIDACINYYRFIEFEISENHYERDIKQIKNNYNRIMELVDNVSYLLHPTLTIPLSPTMIREELLSNLIYSKYKKDDIYFLLLEFLPIGGKRKPRKYNSPQKKTADGKTIVYTHKNSKENTVTQNGKTVKYSIIVKKTE